MNQSTTIIANIETEVFEKIVYEHHIDHSDKGLGPVDQN